MERKYSQELLQKIQEKQYTKQIYGMDVHGLPPTFIAVGQHDFLYIECLAYAKKLHDAGVDTKVVVYNGMGHAYGDNIGVYPQSEDCAIEMGKFIMKNCR